MLDQGETKPGISVKMKGGDFITTTLNGWSPLQAEDIEGNQKAHFNFAINFHCNQSETNMEIKDWYIDTSDFTFWLNIYTSTSISFQYLYNPIRLSLGHS